MKSRGTALELADREWFLAAYNDWGQEFVTQVDTLGIADRDRSRPNNADRSTLLDVRLPCCDIDASVALIYGLGGVPDSK